MFDDILDTAFMEATDDMIVGEEEAELLLFQVVALAVFAGEARLHDRGRLIAGCDIVAGELQRLTCLRAHHDVDIVPDVVILELSADGKTDTGSKNGEKRPSGRLATTARREDIKVIFGACLGNSL